MYNLMTRSFPVVWKHAYWEHRDVHRARSSHSMFQRLYELVNVCLLPPRSLPNQDISGVITVPSPN